MNLNQMLGSMGLVGMTVVACLLLLSVYSIAVILEKLRRFSLASRQSRAFVQRFAGCLQQGKLQDALASARAHAGSPVAAVVSAGVGELIAARELTGGAAAQVELVARALDRSKERKLAELRRGLGGLATIGSTAPFIGLFGTVVGIIHAFEGISATGSGGIAAVSGGIAEALVTTAFGILVAIPAVMAFNYFVSSVERFRVEINATSEQLVDYLTRHVGAAHASR
jgi:biopolymer transport protein ExbB/biopolymer transport protein TolQ